MRLIPTYRPRASALHATRASIAASLCGAFVLASLLFSNPVLLVGVIPSYLLMRLADDVKEIGLIETQPLLEGRNMTMVLGPTKNAGVKRDAETEDTLRSEEEVQGDGNGEADAARPDVGEAHEQVAEAEAPVQ